MEQIFSVIDEIIRSLGPFIMVFGFFFFIAMGTFNTVIGAIKLHEKKETVGENPEGVKGFVYYLASSIVAYVFMSSVVGII